MATTRDARAAGLTLQRVLDLVASGELIAETPAEVALVRRLEGAAIALTTAGAP